MSTTLALAKLIRLKDGALVGTTKTRSVDPDGFVEVQFNPATLKVQRKNNSDYGGATKKMQRRQQLSAEPATLTFDLQFDTAEGENGAPLDVQEKTAKIRAFVDPPKGGKKGAPAPRVRFSWGTFSFMGIVTSISEDYDYFSASGMPLRATLSLSLTEQDLAFEAGEDGPAARTKDAATRPGESAAGQGLGEKGTKDPTESVLAQAGESLQQLLSRLDLDPTAWRAAMNGLDSPLALAAGAEVQLGAEVTAGAGPGLSEGFAVGAEVAGTASLAAALGISGSAEVSAAVVGGFSGSAGGSVTVAAGFGGSARASAAAAAGFSLSAGGGIAASLNQVQVAVTAEATVRARASFAVPGSSATAAAAVGVSGTAAVSASGAVSATGRASASGRAGAAPRPDPRALGYGRSVPLRGRAATPR